MALSQVHVGRVAVTKDDHKQTGLHPAAPACRAPAACPYQQPAPEPPGGPVGRTEGALQAGATVPRGMGVSVPM